MNLRDLRYVVAVAEHLNFNRAAKACHVSQPSLSKQIRKLEEYLDVILFERSNRKVGVTPAGVTVLAHARRILEEADAIRAFARSASDPLAGELRIGLIPTLAPYLLPRILKPIAKALPKLTLLPREGTTAQLSADLKRGELDAVLLALPLLDDELTEITLCHEPFLLAVPARHPLAGHSRISAEEIAGERLLLLEEGHCLRSQALRLCHGAGGADHGDFSATSLETLCQMVAAGYGVTLVPSLAAAKRGGGLRYVAFASPVPARALGLVFRKTSPRAALMRKLASLIRHELPELAEKNTCPIPIQDAH